MTTRRHPPPRSRAVQSQEDLGLDLDRTRNSAPKIALVTLGNVTTPQTLFTQGDNGARGRLMTVSFIDPGTAMAAPAIIELYFGDGGTAPANIDAAGAIPVDIIRLPISGRVSSKTWPIGAGPRGGYTDFFYARFTAAPGITTARAIAEYTQEN
jgi:hypothetical protein